MMKSDDTLMFALGLSARTDCPIDIERTMREASDLIDRRERKLKDVVERLVYFKAGILAKEFEPDSETLRELFEDAEAALR